MVFRLANRMLIQKCGFPTIFSSQQTATSSSDKSPLTSSSAPKGFAKCQVTNDVESAKIVPVLHIARCLGAVSVKLADHHVDEVLDQVLLPG